MPKRPNQHKIEDLSRAKFQLALPKRWVFRNKDKDYGIDGEVELFDDSDKAQGLLFYVQLKATESKKESSILTVDLSIDTLRYYKQLDIPVLLVRYSEFNDCFYIKWVYNVDLFFCKEKAKTHRISFEEKDLWKTNSSVEIEKRLLNLRKIKSGYFNFPIPYSINIYDNKIHDISKPILVIQIKRDLEKYDNIIEFRKKEESVVEVTLNKEELKINILDLAGCSFHSIDLREKEDFAEGISKDILLGIASGMIQIGQIDYCAKIIFENNLQSRLIEKKDLLVYMLPPLFKSSYFEKVLDLIGNILESDNSFEVDIISTVNILISSNSNSKSRTDAVEKYFKNRLNSAIERNDKTQIGIAHYNLGNHYRGQSLFFDSVTNYISAKRFEPKYLNQDYYYSELAGALFLLDKFKISAKLYSKAIEIGTNSIIKALYADALMFSGEYEKAVNAFLKYLDSTDKPIEEFHLKSLCLEGILEEKKIKRQQRNIMLATSKADLSKIDKGITPKEQLEKSLDIDLLCGLAWFNYGIIHSEESDFESAMFSFTMAGLVQTNDIEAWKNAALCCFNSTVEPIIFALIIRTAYSLNGEEFLEHFYFHLEQNGGDKAITQLTEMIEQILPKREIKNTPQIVRMMNKDGEFENIFKQ